MRCPTRPFAALLLALLLPATSIAQTWYDLDYSARLLPDEGVAEVVIAIDPDDGRPTRLDFDMDPQRYTQVKGDGEITRTDDGRTVWIPPREGGELRYRHRISHRRGNNGYDAHITDDWAILRGDDLFPSAHVRATKGARSRARLRFELPEGWDSVDTQYRLHEDREHFIVLNPERRFVRPTGWIIAGKLGIRREIIDEHRISVAAPAGQDYPRLEILGYINATAADLDHLGELPPKLLIVGGSDPMWRGGLSATQSFWLHAERPLISENGTSTLLHEMFHVVTRIRGTRGNDWIAEGLAEYYSVVLLHRAGLVSDSRRDKTLEWMQRHGSKVKTLRAKHSSGPRTARAVTLFAALDADIREATDEEKTLDDVVRSLVERGSRVSLQRLQRAVRDVQGDDSALLDVPLVR